MYVSYNSISFVRSKFIFLAFISQIHSEVNYLFIFSCRINGIPACANYELLTVILRNEWRFNGYVVSDDGAINNIVTQHKYLTNFTETAAACVNAGCNLELGFTVYTNISAAIKTTPQLLTVEKIRYRSKVKIYLWTLFTNIYLRTISLHLSTLSIFSFYCPPFGHLSSTSCSNSSTAALLTIRLCNCKVVLLLTGLPRSDQAKIPCVFPVFFAFSLSSSLFPCFFH